MFRDGGPVDVLLEVVRQLRQFLGRVACNGAPAAGFDGLAHEAPYGVVESVSAGEHGKIGTVGQRLLRFHGVFLTFVCFAG